MISRRHETRSHDEYGATSVEYGIILAFIATIIFGVVGFVGSDVFNCFDAVQGAF